MADNTARTIAAPAFRVEGGALVLLLPAGCCCRLRPGHLAHDRGSHAVTSAAGIYHCCGKVQEPPEARFTGSYLAFRETLKKPST
jgi:hypothetical protein